MVGGGRVIRQRSGVGVGCGPYWNRGEGGTRESDTQEERERAREREAERGREGGKEGKEGTREREEQYQEKVSITGGHGVGRDCS